MSTQQSISRRAVLAGSAVAAIAATSSASADTGITSGSITDILIQLAAIKARHDVEYAKFSKAWDSLKEDRPDLWGDFEIDNPKPVFDRTPLIGPTCGAIFSGNRKATSFQLAAAFVNFWIDLEAEAPSGFQFPPKVVMTALCLLERWDEVVEKVKTRHGAELYRQYLVDLTASEPAPHETARCTPLPEIAQAWVNSLDEEIREQIEQAAELKTNKQNLSADHMREVKEWEAARTNFYRQQYQRIDNATHELGAMTEDEITDRFDVPQWTLEEQLRETRSLSIKELSGKLAYAQDVEEAGCEATAYFLSAAEDARMLGADA